MNKLPANWKEVKLKDALNDYIRGPFGSALKRNELLNKGIAVYEQQHAIYNTRNFRYFIDKNKYEQLKRFTVFENDLIISCSGTLGKVSIIKENDTFGIISQALLLLRPNINIVYPKYLYYYFFSNIGYNALLSRSTGSVQINIAKRKDIENIKLNLPPLAEQKGIASILSSLDDKIELNNKTNRILEEMAQSIFNEWFINFNFPNEDGKPYKKSGGEMIDSELGKIPKGWKVGILGDIISIESGKRPNVSSKNITTEYNIPIYGASNKIGYTNSILFNEKILITGRVGTHGIVQRINFPCWASDNTFVIRSTFHEYTYQNLKRIDYINLNRGTTQPLIVQSDIKKLKVLLNDKIINQYENLTSSFWNLWHKNIFENEKLSGIRDILLPKLMSGEIRIDKNE